MKYICVEIGVGIDMCWVCVDCLLIMCVFVNLLNNVVKYSLFDMVIMCMLMVEYVLKWMFCMICD